MNKNITERIGVIIVISLFVSACFAADPDGHVFAGELKGRWLKDLKPERKAESIATALDLAEKTLEYVGKVKELPAAEKKLLSLRKDWSGKEIEPEDYDGFYCIVRQLRREIIFSHPALDFEKILINRNPPTTYSHNGDQYLGIHSRPGPGLTILTNWKEAPEATAILKDKLPSGATRNPDLHYDAEKVVFAFCDHERGGRLRYFLYEAAVDGAWVRQITGTEADRLETWNNRATVVVEDNDPCYLPDDHIVFVSTRGQTFGRCHWGRYNPAWILYRCDPKGGSIRQLSFANENEYEPSVLNDGRIVFTRWEYTNRHEMLFHMLWWCRPDGTAPTHFYGNDTIAPMEIVEATAIPGTHRVVGTAQGHHSYNTGTSVIIDTNVGENGEEPLEHITPETPYSETHGWPSPHYSHPYPLNEELFLVSRANHPVHHQGQVPPVADRAVYLVDTMGGREFIYEDPDVASFSPIPVIRRKRPPVMPKMTPEKVPAYGTVFLQNAYLTRNDPDGIIKPGMIKALRVNALGVQPRAARMECSSGCPNEIPKKVLGTVPVNENGSAYFKVPAETSLQMQILDENGMAILTEKSLFYLQRGENRSCIGCHESAGSSPDMGAMVGMARLKPVDLKPAAGPQYPGGLSFARTVQPVLDRYCIGCHGLGESPPESRTAAGKIVLIHDGAMKWPRSLRELVKHGDHRVGEKGYMGGGVGDDTAHRNISRPRRFYAYSNKVAHMLVDNHGKCNMDRDSYMRIIEWLDLNAQCYGDYFPNKIEERKIEPGGMSALREYAKTIFGDAFVGQPDRALVNPAQPDESRILLAPLPVKAGGWGQLKGFESRKDPRFRKMEELIEKCIVRTPSENTLGWEPTLEMGAGEDWVIRERAKYMGSRTGTDVKSE